MLFSSLHVAAQLCVMRFLNLRELAALVPSCKAVAAVVLKIQPSDVAPIELKPRSTPGVGIGFALPLLPHPQSALRHLVTRLHLLCDDDSFPGCAPFSLRQRCPQLRALHLDLFRNLAVPFESNPIIRAADFWPLQLRTVRLVWSDVYSQGDVRTLDQMADQLRACLRIASRIQSLRQLHLEATSNLLYGPENEAPFQGQAPFPPILEPLLHLPKLTHLRIALSDYQFGSPDTRWLSKDDCSILAQMPALREFQLTEHGACAWSAQGLLPFLLHSDEAAPLRAQLTRLTVTEYGTSEEALAMVRQLQQACPLVAATLPGGSS